MFKPQMEKTRKQVILCVLCFVYPWLITYEKFVPTLSSIFAKGLA